MEGVLCTEPTLLYTPCAVYLTVLVLIFLLAVPVSPLDLSLAFSFLIIRYCFLSPLLYFPLSVSISSLCLVTNGPPQIFYVFFYAARSKRKYCAFIPPCCSVYKCTKTEWGVIVFPPLSRQQRWSQKRIDICVKGRADIGV